MPKSSRRYVCTTCSKNYAKAEHLIRHERTHTGSKPFVCPLCFRKFSRHDSLARHQRRQGHDGTHHILTGESNGNFNVADVSGTTCNLDTVQHETGISSQPLLESVPLQIQPFEEVLPNSNADDFYLPLTWPGSEELLQSILTSNLGPWADNIELLPTQNLFTDATQGLQDDESPWLSRSSNQQLENGSNAIKNVSQIISDLSANVTHEAESAVLSTVFLDACLHQFFDQFNSIFPICHRPTFAFREWTHPLLLNAIALGSLFVGHKVNIAKGEVLWKLAHTAVATSWHSLILHRGQRDPCNGIQLVLTALLGQTYAMLSGTARLRSTAQIFHSLGFYWARQCDMYSHKRKFRPIDAINADSDEQKLELWRLWAAEETELRALLGHYILDGQLPYFTGAPTCQRHAANSLPLPCSDALFRASTVEEWILQLKQEDYNSITFRQLFSSIFSTPGEIFSSNTKFSSLTVSVVIEGLESFVSEANSVNGAVVGAPSKTTISIALRSLYNYISCSEHLTTGEKTEALLRWHVVCIDAAINFNGLCKNMCSHFNVDQAVFGKLKDGANVTDLKQWIESPCARKALLHAVAVWEALACLPLHQAYAIHIPIVTFTAATIYCAFVMAGSTTVTLPDAIEWDGLMSINMDSVEDITQYNNNNNSQLVDYLSCSAPVTSGTNKNLLYDSNVFLMHLRQIRRPWGICASLENILEQWLSKCGL